MRKMIGLFVLLAAVVAFTAPAAFAQCGHQTAKQSSPVSS